MAKAAAYVIVAGLAGLFAYWFIRAHDLVQHQGAGASRPLMILYLGLMIGAVAILGLLCAYDLGQFFKNNAERWMVQGAASAAPSAEVEQAERLRAAGRPLDAIGVLREYLQAHPYELQTMARIAEIYRYDLKNDLAAALEYEELLKHKLPDDQWAWAALHLAKLYGRRNDLDKSLELLERLDTQYGHTVAGRRAKKALEQVRNPEAQLDEPEEEEEG